MSETMSTTQDLIDLIGSEAANLLFRQKGGERVSIPASLDANHWLAELLGLEAARHIAHRYGGANLELPTAGQRGVTAMRRLCDEALARGESARTAARISGLTERAVYMRKAAGHYRKLRKNGALSGS